VASSRAASQIETGVLLVVALQWLRSAAGYVDPGSGSFVFQALIGGLLALAVATRAFWGRITSFVRREPRKPADR
jgi:hypothetical protein